MLTKKKRAPENTRRRRERQRIHREEVMRILKLAKCRLKAQVEKGEGPSGEGQSPRVEKDEGPSRER